MTNDVSLQFSRHRCLRLEGVPHGQVRPHGNLPPLLGGPRNVVPACERCLVLRHMQLPVADSSRPGKGPRDRSLLSEPRGPALLAGARHGGVVRSSGRGFEGSAGATAAATAGATAFASPQGCHRPTDSPAWVSEPKPATPAGSTAPAPAGSALGQVRRGRAPTDGTPTPSEPKPIAQEPGGSHRALERVRTGRRVAAAHGTPVPSAPKPGS